MNLALKYRPQVFDDVVGHDLSVRALKGMVESKDLPNGLLFSGYSGTGKTTLARIVATELDANVIEVDAASHGGVAEIRKLTDSLKYMNSKEFNVLILDEAQSLTRDAFSAILKTLEEPPPGTLFIFTTTDPQKIPVTVRTRLVEFTFFPLAPVDVMKRLIQVVREEGLPVSGDLLKCIAQTSEGSARKALTDLGLAVSAGVSTGREFQALSGDSVDYSILIRKIVDSDFSGMYDSLDALMPLTTRASAVVDSVSAILRDLMKIRGGVRDASISNLEEKKDLARILSADRIFAMLRILWDLKTQVKSRGDSREDVELALSLLFEVANRGKS